MKATGPNAGLEEREFILAGLIRRMEEDKASPADVNEKDRPPAYLSAPRPAIVGREMSLPPSFPPRGRSGSPCPPRWFAKRPASLNTSRKSPGRSHATANAEQKQGPAR